MSIDSGLCRHLALSWCQLNPVYYLDIHYIYRRLSIGLYFISVSPLMQSLQNAMCSMLGRTQRGRSRAQHARDREADIENAKIGAWCICKARKARPAGPSPHLDCVFVQRRRKKTARHEGPSQCFGCGSFVEERGSSGEARRAEPTSRRAHFRGVWSKSPNSSARRLAIGCFQGNQYVILSSTVQFRTIAFQQTVLPPPPALILCAVARKSLKMTDFSKNGSRNMAKTCAINFFYIRLL